MKQLLVAGGSLDPSVQSIIVAAECLGVEVIPLLGGDQNPAVTWRLKSNALIIDGAQVNPDALFLRQDVFSFFQSGGENELANSEIWYATVMGWALSNPGLGLLNRSTCFHLLNKMHVLHVAMDVGLAVPESFVSNRRIDLEAGIDSGIAQIAKPVTGGSYTQRLSDALKEVEWLEGAALLPAFVQSALSYPEYRVYFVAGQWFVFKITSSSIDYRTDAGCNIVSVPVHRFDQNVLTGLSEMTDHLNFDFCAFDLKTNPDSKEIVFLEVNSAPMFSEFDRIAEGAIAQSLVVALTQND